MSEQPDTLHPLVAAATAHSRFLRRQLDSRPWLAARLAASVDAPLDATALRDFLRAEHVDDSTLKPALRRLRAWIIGHVMVRDLAGLASLTEVTETMTLLADIAVEATVDLHRAALVARHGQPVSADGREQEFIVLGMGKLGGRELNVSSDIDLIFVYPEDGSTAGPKIIDNYEFFTKLGRAVIQALNDLTGDGQVFRVDMRLRPNGDSGPLVASFDMLENYFITQGREWERYAWIKARVMTGIRGAELAAIVRPFIFRKYLDFGAINAMRELHAQIRQEVARKDMANNVKLGPGGIREIEFIAQVFQLIRGGRDKALQIKPTLAVLGLLVERGILSRETGRELAAAYDFLRRVEHRLQYLDDAQTHTLPGNPDDQARLARSMGFTHYEALLEELDDHRAHVGRHFNAVFADPTGKGHDLDTLWSSAGDEALTTAEFTRLGYPDPAAAARRLATLRAGSRYQQMPPSIRSRFDPLIPRVVEAAAPTPDANATFERLLDLLDAISKRGAYLALLQQYPQTLEKVAQIVSASAWAAQFLNRHPILLDEAIDPRILEEELDLGEFRRELAGQLDEIEPDMERQMDLMREQHHAQVFRLLTKDIAGHLTVERHADFLSALADIMVDLAVTMCWRKIRNRHRDDPRFAVLAYGKLGGKELGYASDLDIVFVYDDDAPESAELYTRLSQRTNTWLSAQTPAGSLFETDLRLRPNGDSGLMVVSLDAFRQYQLENAWVWEHQALTRARFCAGDRAIGRKFEAIRVEVLRQPRDLAKLRDEVIAMRQRMVDAHPVRAGVFDLKHSRGGLIDVEFIVQYLVLGYAHTHPGLTGNLGNIALLPMAAELGLIPPDDAAAVADTYREYRRLQHALRLNNQAPRVDPALVAEGAAAVRDLWAQVLG
ncbi:MAG TPA: bifunctional [glutamate--ammonia ligase]-adenylyl-L-tyrosine phosphorylase/[glutamate--ammonia-ligase] adenylyltransferase [Rhodocyclaceae bacterium]|nr:bifunctional [glutamate--ammonia ligase]-adenylyl-L-tyrosine phosphorylase/[glutamate--ammonia-ligase] adenylyltransferase [Rhodocyclaceae bacterium]